MKSEALIGQSSPHLDCVGCETEIIRHNSSQRVRNVMWSWKWTPHTPHLGLLIFSFLLERTPRCQTQSLFLRAQCHSHLSCLKALYLIVIVGISDLPGKHQVSETSSVSRLFSIVPLPDVPLCLGGGQVFLALECIEGNIELVKFWFSYYVAFAGLEDTMQTKLVLSSQRCVSLCLPSARIKGVLHHSQHAVGLLIQDFYPRV